MSERLHEREYAREFRIGSGFGVGRTCEAQESDRMIGLVLENGPSNA